MTSKLDRELSPELELYRKQIEASIKPYIEIKLTNNNNPTWWQSKFGGLPYLPKNCQYPLSWDGEYLYLLAQINFAEVPNIDDFPDKGILQFYIASDEELYGLDFNNPTQQNKFRVLYFPNVDLQEDHLITNFDFLPAIEDWTLPFIGCCRLEFAHKLSPISISDYQFDIFPVDETCQKAPGTFAEYYALFCMDKHKLGGYPNFVQNDLRRQYIQEQKQYTLLLQIDSGNSQTINMIWADRGVGNFFIQKTALKKSNFFNVLYDWNCG